MEHSHGQTVHVVCDRFCVTKAVPSSSRRDYGLKSLKYLLSGSSERKFADPCFIICFVCFGFCSMMFICNYWNRRSRTDKAIIITVFPGNLSIYSHHDTRLCCCSAAQNVWPLRPRGLQHARLLCPPVCPRVCSKSCPLSRWCHPTISPSITPFSSCTQSFPASGSFPLSWLFASGGQTIGASASASVLPMNIQGWFPLEWTGLISSLFVLFWN